MNTPLFALELVAKLVGVPVAMVGVLFAAGVLDHKPANPVRAKASVHASAQQASTSHAPILRTSQAAPSMR